MRFLIVASYLVAEFFRVSIPFHLVFDGKVQEAFLLSFIPNESHIKPSTESLPAIEEIIDSQCRDVPSGIGIPGFQPGIVKDDVFRMLGVPNGTSQGYWPNTRAVFYELIPEQVSLGFLFDRSTERIRQTEASFTSGVNSQIVLITLNGMLGCKLNEQIQQGLEQVRQGKSRQYYFSLNSLKGVIERQRSDRLYIGIWEADLH